MHSRTPRARLRASAPLVAAALVLSVAACGGGGGSAGGGSEGEAPTTLRISTTAVPPSFDPAQLDLGQSAYVWTGIFDTLIAYDFEAKEFVPNAAEWEYSDDAQTLTLVLREDLTFSTGDPVTAEDVAGTIQRSVDTPGPRSADVARIASVEASDDRTVVISLTEADPNLVFALATGLGVIGDPDTLEEDRTALNPIGSGPYTLSDQTVAGSTYVLEKRPDHWNAEAYPFETVTVRVIEDAQANFNALQAGELDSSGPVTPAQTSAAEAAGLTLKTVEGTATGSVLILDKAGEIQPALSDIRVRQAINMAIDRQGIIDALFEGAGAPTVQSFNSGFGAYDPELDGFYEYDVEGAQALMAEAGHADGFAVSMPSTFLSTAYEPTLTQQLGEIGIDVTWEPVPPQEVASSLSSGEYPLAWFFDGGSVPSREASNNFSSSGFLNPYGYTTPEIDKILADIAVTSDPDQQEALYQDLNRYAVENALNAPVASLETVYASKAGYEFVPTNTAVLNLSAYDIAK
ncbi:ABC transporter substrate-binding protein [Arthrobacter sp. TMT4-20]